MTNSMNKKEKSKNPVIQKAKATAKKALEFVFNPHLLLCFGIAWFITNGWSYVMLGVGSLFRIKWMLGVSGAYLAALWLPFTPEKLLTLAIAMALLRLIFPDDRKTLAVLKELREKHKTKKAEKETEKEEKKKRPNDADLRE